VFLAVALIVALSGVALSGCSPSNGAETSSPSSAATNAEFVIDGTVAIIGDFGSGDASQRAVADLVAAEAPDAVLTVGDNVYSNAGYATLVGDYYGSFVAAQKFFPAAGNHDYDEGIENFDDYFGYLNGQREYAVTFGKAEFFVLDGEQGMASLDANHNQEMWLRRAVAASPADIKIVIVHYPPFSSGDRHGSTRDYQWDFADIGIDLVLSGHDHIYERIEVGGVTYVVNGAGGKALYGCGERVSGSAVCFDDNFGALFLSSTANALLGQFVAADGTVVDEFSISVTR
jgi:predicted phosphodiesterase